jgi:colanic acid/amylovoran biosynthesis glycosyltransferase
MRPVVASYCTTFLKPEMRHIYRQVTSLQRFDTFVMTKSRENASMYPFDAVEVLPRPRINFLSRFHKKYIRRMEPVFYRGEYDQLNAVLNRRHADLLHVYFGHTGVHLLPFIKNWSKPSVVSFHGMDIMPRPDEPGYDLRLRELLRAVPIILARSESLINRLVELGCDRRRIRLNRTGIPLDNFPRSPRSAPSDGAWRLVQACRLIEKKGLDASLHAFAAFRRQYPAATFTIAGEGPLEPALRQTAAELGIAHSVRFAGFQSQESLRELYASSHLFLHPSQTTVRQDQEGVPNALLEAMATGLPVIATCHGGIPEAVTHLESGLLTPERDWESLSASLLTVADSLELYLKLSATAAEAVRSKFSQSAAIAALEDSYFEALELSRPTRTVR